MENKGPRFVFSRGSIGGAFGKGLVHQQLQGTILLMVGLTSWVNFEGLHVQETTRGQSFYFRVKNFKRAI